jgi:hypothetical protein
MRKKQGSTTQGEKWQTVTVSDLSSYIELKKAALTRLTMPSEEKHAL